VLSQPWKWWLIGTGYSTATQDSSAHCLRNGQGPNGQERGWGSWGGERQSSPHQLGSLGSTVSSLAGSGAKPQPKFNVVHFSRKIWHLVTTND